MKIHQFEIEDALTNLHSRHSGLTATEVEHRLKEYGKNQIDEVRGESLIFHFVKEFIHFFALILWLAAGLAFYAESQQPNEGVKMLGSVNF